LERSPRPCRRHADAKPTGNWAPAAPDATTDRALHARSVAFYPLCLFQV
jgi:hypothetical protein